MEEWNGSETETVDPRTTASPTVSPHLPRLGTNGCLSLALFFHKVSPSGFLVVVAGGREPLKSGEKCKKRISNPKKTRYDGVSRRPRLLLPAAGLRPIVLSRLLNSSVLLRSFLSWNSFSQRSTILLSSRLRLCGSSIDTPRLATSVRIPFIWAFLYLYGFITTAIGVHFVCLAASVRLR